MSQSVFIPTLATSVLCVRLGSLESIRTSCVSDVQRGSGSAARVGVNIIHLMTTHHSPLTNTAGVRLKHVYPSFFLVPMGCAAFLVTNALASGSLVNEPGLCFVSICI